MKTEDITQYWARKVASYVLFFVGLFMMLVSIAMPFLNECIQKLWFSSPNIYYLLPIPLLTAALFLIVWYDLHRQKHEYRPFIASVGIFLFGYLGLGVSLFPWIIPYQYDIWQAAASGPGLSLMLVGVIPLLPLILGYTVIVTMSFEGNLVMILCIKQSIISYLKTSPTLRQWLWFIILWSGGLGSVLLVTYPIKLLIKFSQ